ncbi:hypothetical protein CCAX7_46580 [Capsulimonas corticalis]|uniref:Uncharacterized protein n=1 Tax=Capsulimonas corticalis TaxID=2219043 RepID=A0A402D509_9BACT|nr:hypothetical protein [Capsulimonas corticalis]BDI32607.1 hypothetical protein CCAX7_46580 [Capsulimonas corticalis]
MIFIVFGPAKNCSADGLNYKIINIAPDSKESVQAVSLNDNDEVLVSFGNGPYGMRSFLFSKGVLKDLKLKGYPEQFATKITNYRRVLGVTQTKQTPNIRSFYLDAQMHIHWLLASGDCEPCDLNSRGETVGVYHHGAEIDNSIMIWSSKGSSKEIILPYNDLKVVGWVNNSEVLASGLAHSPSLYRTLFVNTKSGKVKQEIEHEKLWNINAVLANGNFVGYIQGQLGQRIPFKYLSGKVTELPIEAQSDGNAIGIAYDGKVVGTIYQQATSSDIATLWIGSKSYNLNLLCRNHADWVLQDPVAINTRGTILCQGEYKGRDSACLLIPQN